MKRFLAVLLAAAVTAAAATGCSGNAKQEEGSRDAVDEKQQLAADIITSHDEKKAESGSASAYVDEINIALASDVTDLSPWGTNNAQGRSYTVTSIYETLVTGDWQPVLAKSWEKVDGHTYNFTLYDYIYDTDGNHMTAEDVVFCVDTCVEIGSQPPVCAYLKSAEALSEYEVQLVFDESVGLGNVENVLTNFFLVTKKAYEDSGNGMARMPVATSHYKVTEFTPGYSVTVEDTGNYWQAEELTADRSKANVKKINYYVITESSQRSIALQNGSADYATIAYADREDFVNAEGFQVVDLLGPGANVLLPNVSEKSVCSDPNVRKAIFYAIDNEGVAEGYTTAIAKAINGVGSERYDDYYADTYEELAKDNYYTYDPEKAREYLKEAGYGENELTVTLFAQSSQSYQDEAQVIQAYLNAVGIVCNIETYDNSVMDSHLEEEGDWDLYVVSYTSSDYAVNIFDKFFAKEKFAWGGTQNFIMDDTLQQKFNTVRSIEGHTKENLVDFHNYIVDNAYVKGLLIPMSTFVVTEKFDSFIYQDTNSNAICAGACTYREMQ